MKINRLRIFFIFLIGICLSFSTQAANPVKILKGKVTCDGK